MSIEGFVGNRDVVTRLESAMRTQRLPHALLFSGPPGVGKKHLALELAMWAHCAQPGPHWGCGRCSPCRRIEKLRSHPDQPEHPDVRIIISAGAQLKVQEVREWNREISFRPSEGPARFFIFDPADEMTAEAANALLKTLEEPPADSYLVLISSRPGALLPTIRSRCQTLRFGLLSERDVQSVLESRQAKVQQAGVLAHYADGSLGHAFELLDHLDDVEKTRERALKCLEATFVEHDFQAIADSSSKQREEVRAVLLFCARIVRDLQAVKLDPALELSGWGKDGARVRRMAERVTLPVLTEFGERTLRSVRDLDDYANPLIVMETLFLNAIMESRESRV